MMAAIVVRYLEMTLFGIFAAFAVTVWAGHAQILSSPDLDISSGRCGQALSGTTDLENSLFSRPGLRVLSLFAGDGVMEANLVQRHHNLQIDCVDCRVPRKAVKGLRFVEMDVTHPRIDRSSLGTYDIVILLSPWIKRWAPVSIRDGTTLDYPYAPPPNDVVGPAVEKLLRLSRAPQGGLGSAGVHLLAGVRGDFSNLADYMREFANIKLLRERLGVLFGAIALARERLNRGGQILLETELVNTLMLSHLPSTGAGREENRKYYLVDWEIYREVALEMLRQGFPDLSIVEEPGLSDVLSGPTNNPWGKYLKGWRLGLTQLAK
jgi:hypothetical protein